MGYAKKKRRWQVDVARRADTAAIRRNAKEAGGIEIEEEAAVIVVHKWRSVFPELEDLRDESRKWLRDHGLFVPESEEDLHRRAVAAARVLAVRAQRQRKGKKDRLPIDGRDFEDAIRRLLPVGVTVDTADPKTWPDGPPFATGDGYKIGYSLDYGHEHHFSISRQDQHKVPKPEQEALAKRISAVVGKDASRVFTGVNPAVFHVLIPGKEK